MVSSGNRRSHGVSIGYSKPFSRSLSIQEILLFTKDKLYCNVCISVFSGTIHIGKKLHINNITGVIYRHKYHFCQYNLWCLLDKGHHHALQGGISHCHQKMCMKWNIYAMDGKGQTRPEQWPVHFELACQVTKKGWDTVTMAG